MYIFSGHSLRHAMSAVVALASVLVVGTGCSNSANPPGGAGGASNADDTPLNNPSGYSGSLSGTVADQQSTRASTVDASSAQEVPPNFDTQNTVVDFRDVTGERLVDEKGNVIPAAILTADGTFSAEGLPVGVDFTLCVDIGRDETCDMQSFVKYTQC